MLEQFPPCDGTCMGDVLHRILCLRSSAVHLSPTSRHGHFDAALLALMFANAVLFEVHYHLINWVLDDWQIGDVDVSFNDEFLVSLLRKCSGMLLLASVDGYAVQVSAVHEDYLKSNLGNSQSIDCSNNVSGRRMGEIYFFCQSGYAWSWVAVCQSVRSAGNQTVEHSIADRHHCNQQLFILSVTSTAVLGVSAEGNGRQ